VSLLTRVRRLQASAPRPLSEHDRAMAADPVEILRAVGLEPDGWQQRALRSEADRLLLNCCRQSGKSTIIAALALHQAMYTPDSLTLMVSPSLRQSAELLKKALDLYRAIGRPVPSDAETVLRLELHNDSRIISLPGREQTIRGYSGVALLLADEASRIPDELMASCRPMLAVSHGRLIAASTPWGRRGWWHAEWTEGGAAWERYEVPATSCPRISAEFLADERRALGPLFFASEYLCRFEDTLQSVFGYDDIQRALDPDLAPLFPIGESDAGLRAALAG
jgi:hypothetical protein